MCESLGSVQEDWIAVESAKPCFFFLLKIVPLAFSLNEVGNAVALHQLEYQGESNGLFSQN